VIGVSGTREEKLLRRVLFYEDREQDREQVVGGVCAIPFITSSKENAIYSHQIVRGCNCEEGGRVSWWKREGGEKVLKILVTEHLSFLLFKMFLN